MNAAESKFRAIAPDLMRDLIDAFGFSVLDAAAIAGNGGHESNGFTTLQEIRPTVKGSRGGYGWFQWTGPRRRAFEAFAAARGLNPASAEANIAFLIHELKGDEAKAVAKVKAAHGLDAKVKAFEQAYERAGVKHYPSRLAWANVALDAWHDAKGGDGMVPRAKPVAPPPPPSLPGLDKPALQSTTNVTTGIGACTGVVSAFAGLDWRVALPVVLIIGGCAAWVIWQRMKYARAAREQGL